MNNSLNHPKTRGLGRNLRPLAVALAAIVVGAGSQTASGQDANSYRVVDGELQEADLSFDDSNRIEIAWNWYVANGANYQGTNITINHRTQGIDPALILYPSAIFNTSALRFSLTGSNITSDFFGVTHFGSGTLSLTDTRVQAGYYGVLASDQTNGVASLTRVNIIGRSGVSAMRGAPVAIVDSNIEVTGGGTDFSGAAGLVAGWDYDPSKPRPIDPSLVFAFSTRGGNIRMQGGSIKAVDAGYPAFGAYAVHGGHVDISGTQIEVDSPGGFGAYVGRSPQGSDAAQITLDAASLVVNGDDATGVRAIDGGIARTQDGTINVVGIGARGVAAASEGRATVINTRIDVKGAGVIGLEARDHGVIGMRSGAVTVAGEDAAGVSTGTDGSIVLEGVRVEATGNNSVAVLASGANASATLSNADIVGDALGVRAENGGIARLFDSTVVLNGADAVGVAVQDGGAVGISGGTVSVFGGDAVGVKVGNDGTAQLEGARVEARGANAVAVLLDGTNVNASIRNALIQSDHRGVSVGSGITTALANTTVDVVGNGGVGIAMQGGSLAQISGGRIAASGIDATAVDIVQDSTVELQGSRLEAHGANATAMAVDGSHAMGTLVQGSIAGDHLGVRVDNGGAVALGASTITMNGTGAIGVLVGVDGVATLNQSAVAVAGDGAVGVQVLAENGAYLVNSQIQASGNNAAALLLEGAQASATLDRVGIRTDGNGRGIQLTDGAALALARSTVTVSGQGGTGIDVSNGGRIQGDGLVLSASDASAVALRTDAGSAAPVDIDLSNSSIRSAGLALAVQGDGATSLMLRNSAVQSDSGQLLVASGSGATTLQADASLLAGDILAGADASVALMLANGSVWSGTGTGLASLDVDAGSRWLLRGSSDVGALTNAGMIDFDAATAGNPYKALNVGTLVLNSGAFTFNTSLDAGGASAQTDKLVVSGDASGSGFIHIRNNGGAGAGTGFGPEDGIRIIEVGGASNASFALGAPAIVGIYDYLLVKADGQNWYLQTPEDEEEGGGGEEGGEEGGGEEGGGEEGGGEEGGHIVDLIPGYNLALSAGLKHVEALLDTFHGRLGELRSQREEGFSAWVRGIGNGGTYSPKVTGHSNRGFNITTSGGQVGADYSITGVASNDDMLSYGLFGDTATSNFDVKGRTARGRVRSVGAGAYVSWQQHAPVGTQTGSGFYVDAALKHDRLDTDIRAQSVSGFALTSDYRGRAWSASLETGYGFVLGNHMLIQPQAQLSWTTLDNKDFTDRYGIAVGGQRAESLQARLGVRVEKTLLSEISERSTTVFWDTSIKHEFKGDSSLYAFNKRFSSDLSGSALEFGVGFTTRVSKNVSLYARGGAEVGGRTDFARTFTGGVKVGF